MSPLLYVMFGICIAVFAAILAKWAIGPIYWCG